MPLDHERCRQSIAQFGGHPSSDFEFGRSLRPKQSELDRFIPKAIVLWLNATFILQSATINSSNWFRLRNRILWTMTAFAFRYSSA
jgi:hypothetical protein